MFCRILILLPVLLAPAFMVSCAGRQIKAETRIEYDGGRRTAGLRNGKAYAPRGAPVEVKRAIDAANRITGLPYKWGGGHARFDDSGYDCSGAASYVLRHAGLLSGQMPSKGFLDYGKRGDGKWITVYVRKGHVFLTIAGLRFDTSGRSKQDGPQWRLESRSGKGLVMRHPPGL